MSKPTRRSAARYHRHPQGKRAARKDHIGRPARAAVDERGIWNGNRLRKTRKDAKLTLAELAELVGCTYATISRYEYVDCVPDRDMEDRIEWALAVDSGYFRDPK